MKIDTSFDSAFLQLQNGVNDAKKAAGKVLESVGADKARKVEIVPETKTADRAGTGGINLTV